MRGIVDAKLVLMPDIFDACMRLVRACALHRVWVLSKTASRELPSSASTKTEEVQLAVQ